MIRCLFLFFSAVLLSFGGEPPNVLLIMADDLGYSDLGCYGGEIETPNLDALALGGLRYTQFHNTARCWPTRAALLTGYYAQQVHRDALPELRRGNRPAWAPLVSKMLAPKGYRCYHTGKWHIDGMPLANGFDRSLYLRDQGRFFNPKVLWEDDVKLDPVKLGTGYYATTALGDHAVKTLKEHAEKHRGKPFFHYLAFAAPHFPLHALPEDIAIYEKRYDAGWDVVRKERWERQKEMGVVDPDFPLPAFEREVGPPYPFPDAIKQLGPGETNLPGPWEELTAEQKVFQAKKMAIHAAMIHRMDLEIGRVLHQIREMGVFENTLVMFLSDNGASAEIMVRDDGHDPDAPMGSAATYLCLGPGWSTACNTPFRRHKTWVHEGGSATPFVVHWPAGIAAHGGIHRETVGHVVDLVPTLLELADADYEPKREPFAGRSLVSTFGQQAVKRDEPMWWAHDGHRAIRDGDWKLVSLKDKPWELYDLSKDRHETENVAVDHPERVARLKAAWQKKADHFVSLYPAAAKKPRGPAGGRANPRK